MRDRSFHALALSLSLLLMASACAKALAQTGARPRRQPRRPGTVLFEATGYGNDQTILPIVLIQGGRYVAPPAFHMRSARRQFAAAYYRPGQKYRLLFRGGEVGSVTVKNLETCDQIAANVEVQSSEALDGKGLATNSGSLGGKSIQHRDLTESEKTALLNLAQPVFRRRGVDVPFYPGVSNAVDAADLDGDGKAELIGTFASGPSSQHTLFIIAEPHGNGFKPTLLLFHPSRDKYGSSEHVRRNFVDALDLDGDGISEVITSVNDYRSANDWDYVIYKKHAGRWRSIYSGGGYRCPENRGDH